jgi:hypothetical protein
VKSIEVVFECCCEAVRTIFGGCVGDFYAVVEKTCEECENFWIFITIFFNLAARENLIRNQKNFNFEKLISIFFEAQKSF